ncbi:MAG: metallophosphoesterase [Pseudomonadales bacterium]|nr:metallophosphoesterase [Pseudomonadales bacterium]
MSKSRSLEEMDLTTVSQEHAVFHGGEDQHRLDDLDPGRHYEFDGASFQTLPDLGEEYCRFATVNDVHFGETVCGVIEGSDAGPVFSVGEGETPYPEFMNAGAIAEMQSIDPAAVLVKGDLTAEGTLDEYARFLEFYGQFGEKLYHVRGNHEAYHRQDIRTEPRICVELPGVTLAMIDTVRPGSEGGTVYDEDLEWLDELAARVDTPLLVFGHHQIWNPATPYRSENYFGIQPDESEKFIDLVARRPAIRGYFSGHTHRNRVRRFPQTKDVPWVEVACVKDFPGSWAEYRVCERGIVQVHHRISSPEALAWTEKTKAMYDGAYYEYAFGDLSDRCFVVCEY